MPDSNKSDKDYLNYNFKATVAGWGWTEDVSKLESRGETSNVLQKVELPLINNDECTIWYRSKGKSVIVSSKQFCAGFEKGGKDACRVSQPNSLRDLFYFIFIFKYRAILEDQFGLKTRPTMYTWR